MSFCHFQQTITNISCIRQQKSSSHLSHIDMGMVSLSSLDFSIFTMIYLTAKPVRIYSWQQTALCFSSLTLANLASWLVNCQESSLHLSQNHKITNHFSVETQRKIGFSQAFFLMSSQGLLPCQGFGSTCEFL